MEMWGKIQFVHDPTALSGREDERVGQIAERLTSVSGELLVASLDAR